MRALLLLPLAVLAAIPFLRPLLEPRKADPEVLRAAYEAPLPAPNEPLAVYHLGHSLVGRDMPAMLAQLSPEGHRYESQLGWGTSLRQHWQGGGAINGFEAENDHARFRDAREAIGSGEYDAVILTEMVELRDAIKYHESARHLALWAELARAANPDTRVYLYESWHRLDDPEGWLTRLDTDLDDLWLSRVLGPDLSGKGAERPVRVIPAGQAMAAFVRAVEDAGGISDIANRESLFARTSEGTPDPIHVNDLGAYLVALTHYSVLYHRSPEGLPHQLLRADGTPADAPSEEVAKLMQRIVWEVVSSSRLTGVGS